MGYKETFLERESKGRKHDYRGSQGQEHRHKRAEPIGKREKWPLVLPHSQEGNEQQVWKGSKKPRGQISKIGSYGYYKYSGKSWDSLRREGLSQ